MCKFNGSPMQVWGLRVQSRSGAKPDVGNVVKVTTKSGTEWYTRITFVISSMASKSGFWSVLGEDKEESEWLTNEIHKGRITPDGDLISPAEDVHIDEVDTGDSPAAA